ncbi:hypothetical protein GJ496_004215 [Pomphorhynchus laevis]|nr:hypothetical protein GJ496_004215 [Pomphorhynchus laevis]
MNNLFNTAYASLRQVKDLHTAKMSYSSGRRKNIEPALANNANNSEIVVSCKSLLNAIRSLVNVSVQRPCQCIVSGCLMTFLSLLLDGNVPPLNSSKNFRWSTTTEEMWWITSYRQQLLSQTSHS